MLKRLFSVVLSGVIVASLIVPATGLDRRVRIVNLTGFVMVNFYASNVDAKTWEEDILGSDVLASGSSVMINIDDGTGYCKYDFRAVFEDGEEVTKSQVNVCEVATFTFN